ncbi:serine/threonine-protein kinase [Nonomuraea pusilla]|uniref:Serine/threonine protein kinase n=1 Tax=Nonomuraea pusilla TaxID=46177 RepID=A0A1H7G847_9ACTN|nr:serine/threonine-protein kinase [Nonomuraea pusilla]SEK34311.1 Serine/threonine protein kinase [Nonomuraea pusilla]
MDEPLVEGDPLRLGPYELAARLGEGGQGVVYLGRTESGARVAVKLLHHGLLADPDARRRFLREVELARRVARFSTAPVLDADLDGRRAYLVSEYVPGPSLRDLVAAEGPRRGAALDRLAVSTATALAAIHRAGVLHRDFKPGNILMGPEGPVVIDFGIARALDTPGTASTGPLMGTPSYMAPEQLGGEPVTAAADIFAWGVTMVFAASGRPAFGADSTPAVINRIINKEPEISGLDEPLRGLVVASLSKDPSRRPSADELVARLTSFSSSAPPSAASPARRRRTVLAAVLGCMAAVLLVAGGVLFGAGGPPVGSPAEGEATTSQPAVRSTTAHPASHAATPSAGATGQRRTPPPQAGRTPGAKKSAPVGRPTRTADRVSSPMGERPDDGRTSDEPAPPPEPTSQPPATTAPPFPTYNPPTYYNPTPMENPYTCIPSMC